MTTDRGTSVVVREAHHPLSIASVESAARSVGIDEATAVLAAQNVLSGKSGGVLFSGRQGAGKDTIAPAVLAAAGITDAVQCRVSDAIKDEMDVIIDAITNSHTHAEAVTATAAAVDLRVDHATVLVDLLWDATRIANHGLTGRTRTPAIRLALQYHGHEARLETHPGYWITACYRRLVPLLAEGKMVYLTDGRFPGEIQMASDLGLYTVRLFVDPEVQLQRIMGRDGHAPDQASLEHPGESLLDDYEGFNLIVDNSGDMDTTVTCVTQRLVRHLTR